MVDIRKDGRGHSAGKEGALRNIQSLVACPRSTEHGSFAKRARIASHSAQTGRADDDHGSLHARDALPTSADEPDGAEDPLNLKCRTMRGGSPPPESTSHRFTFFSAMVILTPLPHSRVNQAFPAWVWAPFPASALSAGAFSA